MTGTTKNDFMTIGLKEKHIPNTFYRIGDESDFIPEHFTRFALTFDEAITEKEAEQISQIMGYYWVTTLHAKRGEETLNKWELLDEGKILLFHSGTIARDANGTVRTISQSKHPVERIQQFENELNGYLRSGSKRRNDNSKLVEGLNRVLIASMWINKVQNPWIGNEVTPAAATGNENNILYKEAEDLTFKDIKALQSLARSLSVENTTIKNNVANLFPVLTELTNLAKVAAK